MLREKDAIFPSPTIPGLSVTRTRCPERRKVYVCQQREATDKTTPTIATASVTGLGAELVCTSTTLMMTWVEGCGVGVEAIPTGPWIITPNERSRFPGKSGYDLSAMPCAR